MTLIHTFNIAEKFISINGEGNLAGYLSTFIRFAGCNLNCSYCDTAWAIDSNYLGEKLTVYQLYQYIVKANTKYVTLTGGEPLIQDDIYSLLQVILEHNTLHIEIESNGSVDIAPFAVLSDRISFTLDYKLPTSKMEYAMVTNNYAFLKMKDCVKFVVGSMEDLEMAFDIVNQYKLTEKCVVSISPVYSEIEPSVIVSYMRENKINNVKLQLQLHKFIWPPTTRGV